VGKLKMKKALDILFKGYVLTIFVIFGKFNIGSTGKIKSTTIVMHMEQF
jgi:hypothetical protein